MAESQPGDGGASESVHKWPTWLIVLLGGAGVLYLLNPTLGLFELIPDQLPLVGNLDEGAAAMLVYHGLQELRSRRKS
ncbi:MAG: DUF1232 domain-containing protein [Anaerolineales bacterium]|nr:DUF1232 domain-containing protein [Anaerolineales bacterium]